LGGDSWTWAEISKFYVACEVWEPIANDLVHEADRSDTKVSRENSLKFVTEKWEKLIDPLPHPQIILGRWNFAGTRPPPRPVGKKISVPQLP